MEKAFSKNNSLVMRHFRRYFEYIALLVILVTIIVPSKTENIFAENADFPVEVKFLNTYNNPNYFKEGEAQSSNSSSLIKTSDDKYVLIDTGIKSDGITRVIKDSLKEYQNKSSDLIIDYLVVSHLDSDHYGNASTIIDDKDIEVKNLIIKYDSAAINNNSTKKKAFDGIIRSAKKEKAFLYTNAADYKVDNEAVKDYANYNTMNAEGTGNAVISVGRHLKLYFYNTKDVFGSIDTKNDSRCQKASALIYTRNINNSNLLKDKEGNYLRFDNRNNDYPNINFEKTKELKKDGKNFTQFWYASAGLPKYNTCYLPNGNSYAILAEVKTDAGNKYIYFTNDIENFGYNFLIPSNEDVTYYSATENKNVTTKHTVYGSSQRLTTRDANEIYGQANFDGKSIRKTGEVKVPSETKAALEVADKLGNKLNDIVIYQMSHHGINNVPDAIETLNLNRKNLYAVANAGSDSSSHSGRARTYYYTLANATRLFAGQNQGDGVFCAISKTGEAKCGYNKIKNNTLTFDNNGGSGIMPKQTCLSNIKCNITISDVKPIKDNHTFLGWAKSPSSATGVYQEGDKISISGDTILYAIWAPIYTLSYDANGGSSTPSNQTCSPKTTTGSCKIKVSEILPVFSRHNFKGWSKTSDVTALYGANSSISLKANTTLYAIWEEVAENNPNPAPSLPIYTLSFNTQGGEGVFNPLTCSPTELASACNVSISQNIPTKEGNKFLGWAIDEETEIPDYMPSSNFTFTPNIYNETLYAVWGGEKVQWEQSQEYVVNSEADLIVIIDYPMENFVSLEVDETIVDKANYDLRPGNTTLFIYSQFADNLPIGQHTLTANYVNDIKVNTIFTVSNTENLADSGSNSQTCITNPEMEGCQELPSTGPLEIVLAIIVIASISFTGYYFYRTHQTLNKLEILVSGKIPPSSKSKKS